MPSDHDFGLINRILVNTKDYTQSVMDWPGELGRLSPWAVVSYKILCQPRSIEIICMSHII